MEIFTKKISYILILVVFFSAMLCTYSDELFKSFVTNDKDLENKLLFFDKLSDCTKHEYYAEGQGKYAIFGKVNNACNVQWTIVDCNFPEGVYQKFADIQKNKTMERYNRLREGKFIELKDKDTRYLYKMGNLYCQSNY